MNSLFIHSFQIIAVLLAIIGNQLPLGALQVQQSTGTATINIPSQTLSTTPGTPSTSTPTSTPVPPSSTSTLMPLPEITLIFPASTDTPTLTLTPDDFNKYKTPVPATTSNEQEIPQRYRLLIIVLAILWVLLAGFLVIYLRQVL